MILAAAPLDQLKTYTNSGLGGTSIAPLGVKTSHGSAALFGSLGSDNSCREAFILRPGCEEAELGRVGVRLLETDAFPVRGEDSAERGGSLEPSRRSLKWAERVQDFSCARI